MKNYKAEIEKILEECVDDFYIINHPISEISEKLVSLFREIAKEALPNEIPKSVNDGGQGFFEKRGYINGFNNARSETRSNIEKVIGEK